MGDWRDETSYNNTPFKSNNRRKENWTRREPQEQGG